MLLLQGGRTIYCKRAAAAIDGPPAKRALYVSSEASDAASPTSVLDNSGAGLDAGQAAAMDELRARVEAECNEVCINIVCTTSSALPVVFLRWHGSSLCHKARRRTNAPNSQHVNQMSDASHHTLPLHSALP